MGSPAFAIELLKHPERLRDGSSRILRVLDCLRVLCLLRLVDLRRPLCHMALTRWAQNRELRLRVVAGLTTHRWLRPEVVRAPPPVAGQI